MSNINYTVAKEKNDRGNGYYDNDCYDNCYLTQFLIIIKTKSFPYFYVNSIFIFYPNSYIY